MTTTALRSTKVERVRSITIDHLRALVKISPVDMARLVLADFNDVLSSLVSNLRQDQDLQYAFLEALVHVVVRWLRRGGEGRGEKVSHLLFLFLSFFPCKSAALCGLGCVADTLLASLSLSLQDTNAEESGFYLPDTVQETYLDLMCTVGMTLCGGALIFLCALVFSAVDVLAVSNMPPIFSILYSLPHLTFFPPSTLSAPTDDGVPLLAIARQAARQ